MSLMAMNRAFKKHGMIWGGIMAVLMIIGVAFTSLGSSISRGGSAAPANAPEEAPVATVGDTKVSAAELDRRLEMALRRQAQFGAMPTLTAAQKESARVSMLESIKQEQALVLAAKKAGVTVTDSDLKQERESLWAQNRTGVAGMLSLNEKATDSEIEAELVKQRVAPTLDAFLRDRIPDATLRLQVYQKGLQASLKKQVQVTEAEVRRSYDEIQVRHILIKVGQGGLPEGQAKAKAEKILAEVKADPSKMAALADQYTEDIGNKDPKTGKKKGGFYDWATASDYVPEFSKGAMDAGIGKVAPDLVKTQFGFHILKLEGERPGKNLPKDFDKEKQKYIDQFADRQVGAKLQAAIDAEMPNVTVTITAPLLNAAKLMADAEKQTGDTKAQNATFEQALAELAKVKKEDDINGIAPQMKASLYSAMKKTKEAIAASEEALNYGNTVEARVALAKLYLDDKNNTAALTQLAEAEKLAVPSFQLQSEIGSLYARAGDKAKADAAQKKAQELMMRMIEMQQKQQAAAKATAPVPVASPAASASPSAPASPASVAPTASASPAPVPTK